jgi:hypothetical protein
MGRYDCYILRVWRSQGEHGEQWAARIEHVSGTELLRFSDPEALLQYLQERIAPRSNEQAAPSPQPRREECSQ